MYSKLFALIIAVFFIIALTTNASAEAFAKWIDHYSGQPENGDSYGSHIALDQQGFIYVSGRSMLDGHQDITTIKYDTDGTPIWTNRHRPDGHVHSWIRIFLLDNSGSMYVLGDSRTPDDNVNCELFKIDAATGQTLWSRLYDSPSKTADYSVRMAFDKFGDIYFNAKSEKKLLIFKYHPDGSLEWQRAYTDIHDSTLHVGQITTDTAGNVYSIGYTYDGRSTVVKYSPSGDRLMDETYSSPEYSSSLSRLSVAANGDIFTAGYRYHPESKYDWLIWKLNADGSTAWTFDCFGDAQWPGGMHDFIDDICLDESGNLYVAGMVGYEETLTDIVLMKFLSDGTNVWTQRQDCGLQLSDDPDDMFLAANGDIYIAGGTQRPNKSGCDFLLLKYDNDGVLDWARRYIGPFNSNNFAVSVVADQAGNVYTTGFSQSGSDLSDVYTTIKYAPYPVDLGDVNADSEVDVADAVALINYIFKEGEGSDPVEISDANCDSFVNVGDIVYLINYVFNGGPACDCLN